MLLTDQKPKMQKIGEWWKLGSLTDAFALGTKAPKSLNQSGTWYLFEHIYVPLKIVSSAGMPDSWTYYDIGFSFSELADCYALKYSGNYWPEWFESASAFRTAAASDQSIVLKKIIATVRMNFEKYMKLIELGGYTYNPLYNVDGEELFSSADLHGDEIRTNEFDDTNQHTVSTYDAAAKEESTDRSYSANGGDKTTTTHDGTGQGIAAADNAFGAAVSSTDYYHVDKRIRRGNIGLTKSTELAAAAREDFRNNIISEFFDDLNQSLLIPIY